MRLTREQAAIVGAFTGYAAGPFEDIQNYADKLLNETTMTHSFADKEFCRRLKDAAKDDFLSICAERTK